MTDTRLAALMQIAAESFEVEVGQAAPADIQPDMVQAIQAPRPGIFSPDQQQAIIRMFDF